MTYPSIAKMTIGELLEFSKLSNVKRRIRERLAAQVKRPGFSPLIGLMRLSCKSADCESVRQNAVRVCGKCLATYIKVGDLIQAAGNRRPQKNAKKMALEVSR